MAIVGGEVFIEILPDMVGFDAALEEGLREHTDAVVADNPGMFDGLSAGVETAETDVTDSMGRIALAAEAAGDTFARVGVHAAEGWAVSMDAVDGISREVADTTLQAGTDMAAAWAATAAGVEESSGRYVDSAGRLHEANGRFVSDGSKVKGAGKEIEDGLDGIGKKSEETGSIFDRISSSIGSGFQRAANTMQLAGIPLSGELNEIGAKFKDAETAGTGFTTTLSAVGGLTVASAAVAGVAFLDMGSKFQTATAQMSASGNIPIQLADQIGQAFLHSGSDVVYSAKEQEEAFGAVAGQMAAVQGHTLTVAQTVTFMSHAMDLAEESGDSLKSATADLSGEMQAFQIPLSGVADASVDLFNASRITGVGIDSLSSTLDRMKSRLGVAAPSLTDLSTMLVDLAEHGVTGSRGLMVVNTAMTTLLKSTQTLQAAQEKANATFGTKEASDRLAVANAQSTLSIAEGVGHASASTLAADSLKLSEAQQALNAYVKAGAPALTGTSLAIQQLGLQVYNAQGQFVGMSAVIAQLQPKLERMTEQQQLAALGAVFGSSANKALLDTVLAGPAAYDRANKAVTDAAAAHRALVVQQQTLGHEFESIKVIVEDFGTVIGLRLLPFLHDALQGFADFVGFIVDHKYILEGIGALIGVVLVGALASFAVSMTVAGLAALGAAFPFTVLGASAGAAAIGISAAAAPIALIVIGLAALGVAAYELYEHWNTVWADIKSTFDTVVAFLRSGLGTLAVLITGPLAPLLLLALHWQQVWGAMRAPVMAVVDFMEGIGDALSGPVLAIVDVFAALPGEIARIAEAIPSFFERLPDRIVSFFVGLPDRVLDEVKALPDQLLDLALNLLITWPILLAREAITAGVAIVTGLIDGLTVAVPAVFDWFVGLPARILSLSLNVGSVGIGMIGDIVDGLAAGAVGLWHFFTDLPGDIAGIFSGGGGTTKGAPSGGAGKAALHTAGASIIGSILDGLGDAAVGIFTWFLELPGQILDHIAAGTGDQFNRAGAAFVRAILDGMAGAAGDVGDFFANVWGNVASTTSAVWDPVVAVISDVWDDIYTVIHAVWTGISDYLTVEWTIVSTTARVLWAIVYYVIIEVWQLIDEGIRTAWEATSGFIVTAWDAFADIAREAWDPVYTAVVGVWDRLTGGIENVWTAVAAWLTAAWDAFVDVADTAWQAISAAVTAIWNLLSAGIETIWDALRDFLISEWTAFLAIARALWQPVSDAITAIWNALEALVRAVWLELRDFLMSEWSAFAAVANSLWSAVSSRVVAAWHVLDIGVRAVWQGLDTFLVTAWTGFETVAAGIWKTIVSGISGAWSGLTGMAENVWAGVKSAFTSGANDVIGVLDSFIGLLRDIPGVKQAGLKLIPRLAGGGAITEGAQPAALAGIPGLAAGGTWGVYDSPTVLVGEGSRHHPEVVIPTDPQYRANAVGLINAALTMMSYSGGQARAGRPAFERGGMFDLSAPAMEAGGAVVNVFSAPALAAGGAFGPAGAPGVSGLAGRGGAGGAGGLAALAGVPGLAGLAGNGGAAGAAAATGAIWAALGGVPALASGGVIDARSFPTSVMAGMPALDSGGIVGNLTGSIGAIAGDVGSGVGAVGKAAGSAATGIGGALSSVASAFSGLASEAANWVLGAISTAMIEPMENLAISGMERLPEPIAGIGVTVVKAIANYITSQKPAATAAGGIGGGGGVIPGYSGTAGVAQWTPVATSVANALGQPGAVGAILRRIAFESGGNPTAVNKYDINWKEGHPSVGLAQVIHGTFDEYAGPYINTGPFSYGVSEDPMANVYAGMNYATHDYGSIAAVDPLRRPEGYEAGGLLPATVFSPSAALAGLLGAPVAGPTMYDQGGILPPGLTLALNNTGVDERVISPSGAGGGGGVTIAAGAVQVEVVIGDGGSGDMGTVRTTVQSAITDALEQVMQIAGSAGAFGGSR